MLARIDARIHLRINCPTQAVGDSIFIESVNVSVEQAAGRGIASGSGGLVGTTPRGPLVWECTSANVFLPLDVLANISGRPFYSGAAVISASLDILYASGAEFRATYGPAIVKLAG